MPLFRGVTVTIHTPFAIDGLRETPLPALSTTAQIIEEENKFASVFVPAHAQSLFWLSYSTEVPLDDSFFVFKLFINRRHVVTWSCDDEQEWRGKVQFALFKSSEGDDIHGGAGMEKRALQFGDVGPGHDEDRCVEVRVLRASSKSRAPRELEVGKNVTVGNGIQLPEAGHTMRGQPRRFYNFALIDPKDDPFATFRFYYRTHEEIASLDCRLSQAQGSRVVTAPGRKTVIRQVPTGKLMKAQGVRVSRLPQAINRIPSSSPSPPSTPSIPPAPSHPPPIIPRSTGEVNLRRLSIPPSTILRPLLEHGPLPALPTKQVVDSGSPKSDEGSAKTKRQNTGNVLRSLLHGAKTRKSNGDSVA